MSIQKTSTCLLIIIFFTSFFIFYSYNIAFADKAMDIYFLYEKYKQGYYDNKVNNIYYDPNIYTLNELLDIGYRCSLVDKRLILAVILQESNGQFYCINDNTLKKSQCFNDKKSAIKFAVQNGNTNIDVGLMQINYKSWVNHFNFSLNDLLTPAYNICIGSKILKYYLLQNTKWQWNGWRGIGFYNTGANNNIDRQLKYAKSVYKKFNSLSKKSPIIE